MLCFHVRFTFQLFFWGYLTTLHWHHMNIIWIHTLLPSWMWHKNYRLSLSILLMHIHILQIQDVFLCFWAPLWLVLVWIFAFLLAWFKWTCNVATDFIKYSRTSLDVNSGHDWKIHCKMPLSVWMEQRWNMQHVGTVSGLVLMRFSVSYCYVISVVVLVTPWDVQWVGFFIILFFYLLVPGWTFSHFI